MKNVALYTDGSCLGNPGPGGWAALLRFGDSEKMLTGNAKDTTNNRMELLAVIKGLESLKEPCAVHIHTDSQYVMNAFVKGWLDNWQKKGWKNSQKKPVKNKDLWEMILKETSIHQIQWEWIKGHSGHPENERVDDAAREAAEQAGY